MQIKDSKGDPHGFRVFLSDHNLPQSLILRYRWNRLHVLFTLVATYITHYTDMKTYLTTRCLHKSDLVTSLIKDNTDDPTTMLQLKILAIIGKSSLDHGLSDFIAPMRDKFITWMLSQQSRNVIPAWRQLHQRTSSFWLTSPMINLETQLVQSIRSFGH